MSRQSKRVTRAEYQTRAHEFAHTKNRRFTDDQVTAIRENRKGMTDQQQAETYGVHKNTIYRIRRRENYAL